MTTHETLTKGFDALRSAASLAAELILTLEADNSIDETDMAYLAGYVGAIIAATSRLVEATANVKQSVEV